ncbi:MAG: hypothetical protein NUV65_02240 [Candidatus Roizmanbacteria bacterium]|nr:hypothetical protein [Candidatus Roizmanbacteria bacterium]
MKNFIKKAKEKLHADLPFLSILFIFIVLSSYPVFKSGFFRTIDDITPVRIAYLTRELMHIDWVNQFPVRLSGELAHGFGYPLYLFYAPLTYYAGAVIMLILKVNSIIATKAVYVFPLIVGPVLCYWAARQILKPLPALVVACLYTLFPFRGYDSYIRGGVGKAWAMAFIPGAFGGIFLSQKNKHSTDRSNELGFLLFSLFLTLAIISHNISTILFIPLFFLYGIVFLLSKKQYWFYFFLTLGLSAFFWLPSAFYLNIVKVNYSNQNTGQLLNFIEPVSNLFRVTVPYRGDDRYSVLFILYYLVVFTALTIKKDALSIKQKRGFIFFAVVSTLGFVVLFKPAQGLWEFTLPITRLLQFPWRILIILSFTLPLSLGFVLQKISSRTIQIVLAFVLIITSLYHLSAFKPKEYSFFFEYKAEDTGPCATSWGDEYLPIWVKDCVSNPSTTIAYFDNQKNSISSSHGNSTNITVVTDSKQKATLFVNKYYFPGWKATVDNSPVSLAHPRTVHGIFSLIVPKGKHTTHIFFSKTPIMLLADLVSLFSLVYFLFRLKVISRRKINP